MTETAVLELSDCLSLPSPHTISGTNTRGSFQLLVCYEGIQYPRSSMETSYYKIAAIVPQINGRFVNVEVGHLDFTLERLASLNQLSIGYVFVREIYRKNGVFHEMYNMCIDFGREKFPEGFRVFLETEPDNVPMASFVNNRGFVRQGHTGSFIEYALMIPSK